MRRLHVHNCAPLTIHSPSRGITTDAISAENLYAFGAKHVTKGLGRITEGIMTKGEGSYVVYDDGRRMLDFTCGIGVTSLGKLCFLDDVEVAWGCGGSNGFKNFPPIPGRAILPIYNTFALYADSANVGKDPLFLDLPGFPHSRRLM